MKALDNQKDEFIKQKFQNDDLISKKADDVFNNFLKGDVNMEEKEKVVKIENATKKFNKKRFLAVAASLLVVFVAVNGYAATKGYNNVFFMIRNLVTGQAGHAEKDEILMDRDITISYSNINLSKDLSIQVNKLQVKDDEAKLFLSVTEHTGKNYISKAIVRDNANDKILSDEVFATKSVSDGTEVTYQKEIVLKGMTSSTNEITLELIDKSKESLAKLLIDLDKKEIDIISGGAQDGEMEKLSEIELKEEFGKLLNSVPELGGEVIPSRAQKICKLDTALKYVIEKDGSDKASTDKVLEAYNEIFGENVTKPEDLLVKDDSFITIKNGQFVEEGNDAPFGVLVLDVKYLVYEAGMYTADFIYVMPSDGNYADNNIESLPQFVTSVEFTINKDYKYSKYRIENYDQLYHNEYNSEEYSEGTSRVEDTDNVDANHGYTENIVTPSTSTNTVVTEPTQPAPSTNTTATNTVSETHTTNYDISKIDNYASSMIWSDYWSPGLRLSYPAIFNLNEVGGYMRGSSQGSLATTISGLAVGINKETNTPIESNMTIEIYEPMIVTYQDDAQINDYIYTVSGKRARGAGFTNSLDDFWALASSNNDTLSNRTEDYFHTEFLSDGNSVIYRISITSDNWENYKVTNIVNRLLGSLTPTSY